MAPERISRRRPCHELLDYTVVVLKDGKLKFLDLTGKAVNVSRNGLCFVTKYPLRSGCVLEFRNRFLRRSRGVVMWIKNIGGLYMAGAKLIGKGDMV